jgi:hypothetical membrane protein
VLRRLEVIWRYSWLLGFALFWVFLALSISRNPWFDLWRHALSDLGDARMAADPWVYNAGLVVVGAILCAYSLYVAYVSRGRLAVFSSALLFTAGLFLALIGVFPSGTRPHTFVSTWFFVQVWLSSIPLLVDSVRSGRTAYVASMASVSILAPAVAYAVEALVGWPSVAVLELYGAVVVGLYLAAVTRFVKG